MPVFRGTNGKFCWVPAESVIRAEQGEGGLCTQLILVAPPGSPPGAVALCEVEGTVQTVGATLDAHLAKFPAVLR